MEPQVDFPNDWHAPAELSRALPREVQMSAGGIFVVILCICLLAGAGVLFVFMRGKQATEVAHIATLRSEGRVAPGEVTKLWRSGKGGSTHMVGYTFVADGRPYWGESTTPDTIWKALQVGSALSVQYAPSDPNVSHPTGWEMDAMPAWLPFLIPAMFGIPVLILAVSVKRQAGLLADGLPAPGVVTRSVRVKGGWVAHYQFRLNNGTVAKGRSQMPGRLSDGTVICVLYDPERPKRNRTYPMSWYRLAS